MQPWVAAVPPQTAAILAQPEKMWASSRYFLGAISMMVTY
jgi:hypothetical protein